MAMKIYHQSLDCCFEYNLERIKRVKLNYKFYKSRLNRIEGVCKAIISGCLYYTLQLVAVLPQAPNYASKPMFAALPGASRNVIRGRGILRRRKKWFGR